MDVSRVRADGPVRTSPSPDARRRPASTTFSAGVAFVRGLVGVVLACLLLANPAALPLSGGAVPRAAVIIEAAALLLVVAALDAGLGIATFFGRNWARVLLMLTCAATIVGAFISQASGGPRLTLGSGLPHVALGILLLLALTSPAARDFATRRLFGARAV